jgi:hypothetical protein
MKNIESPGVCVIDSVAGSLCTPVQDLHKFRDTYCLRTNTDCFLTYYSLQLYTSSLQKFCPCETDCEINYKYPMIDQDCFLTADAGQLYDSNTEKFCSV